MSETEKEQEKSKLIKKVLFVTERFHLLIQKGFFGGGPYTLHL